MATNYPKVPHTINNVRIDYPFLFTPRKAENPGDIEKYEVTLLIPKTDKAGIAALRAKIMEALPEEFKSGTKPAAGVNIPLKDGDTPKNNGEERGDEFKGMCFLKASSQFRPQNVIKKGGVLREASQDDIYSGCWCHIAVAFRAYNNSGNKGISTYLQAVCKAKDDEPFGGTGVSAEAAFSDVADTAGNENTVEAPEADDWMS